MKEKTKITSGNLISHPINYFKNKIGLFKYERGFKNAEKLCLTLEKTNFESLELTNAKLISDLKYIIDVMENHTYHTLINSFISTIESNKNIFEKKALEQINSIIKNWVTLIKKENFYEEEYISFCGEIEKTPKIFVKILQTIEKTLDKDQYEKRLEDIKKRILIYLNKTKRAKEVMLSTNFSFMSPYDFEKFIANLFNSFGYKTNITSKTGDYGIDVIAENNSEKIAIQCKKYQEDNKVGNQTIQMLLGAMQLRGLKADKGIVITTSRFTRQAYKQAEDNNVELWDKNILHQKIKECFIDIY